MIPRKFELLPEHLYPSQEWAIVETAFSQPWMGNAETIFALSNGFIGVRGLPEEGRPTIESASFCNGFHETWPIVHAEEAYGFARTGQTMVNVPDATLLKLYVDDEPFFLPTARMVEYRRELDFRTGVLSRTIHWAAPSGKQVYITSRRLVSLEYRHLGAISYEVTVDTDAPVVISSQLLNRQDSFASDERGNGGASSDPRRAKGFTQRVLNARHHLERDLRICTGYRTTNSGMVLGAGMDHIMETDNPWQMQRSWSEDLGKVVFTVDARPGVPVRLTKFFTYHTSRTVPAVEVVDRACRTLDRALRDGYQHLEERQRSFLGEFWSHADVQVDAEPQVQQAIRWNIFQLCQASARAETTGIPAKGLTGQAYEGHYFWDTEIYVTPFLTYTDPRISRNLLRFRHSMLHHARDRARELSESGALFPWRTINGEEASSYYAAGTAQYHINADIAYAIKNYLDARGDFDLVAEVGAEILVETARLWCDLGFFSPETGDFHIHGVTGPDEYTTVVNDNTFTNLMARRNLRFAAAMVRRLQKERPEAYAHLVHETGLVETECAEWDLAADAMYIPFDMERGILPQDDNFLEKERWDFAGTPIDRYPLLLHFHPLVIYRHQVIKQADVVLAMVLLGDEFTLEDKRRNFDYYDPLTTGDSSLSACVQSILAAEIGYEEKALEYFQYALFMDLANVAGNVVDGAHIASTGGVWMAITYGFGGMRNYNGALSFDPRLPSTWGNLSFRVRYHQSRIEVTLERERYRFELIEGEPAEITVCGTPLKLLPGAPLEVSPPGERPE
ncbi:kojibiose phosphorylase [Alkalispirochaeta sphaeroplastigenens]|uniref:Kojibiose phosphorylase n=1 Tax=Alkalispirochaeta sphaeroplastigenens TaxID=1187066 RepID=A0A2S4JX79_9SPIO|nr:glycosyl hydrolase family 65 protein [Alkalispirochaeta sphaeroplastigenens]POR04137.1 kojibiose phosphorylase [Alkalispirochaeta sphaeroplastigenens]